MRGFWAGGGNALRAKVLMVVQEHLALTCLFTDKELLLKVTSYKPVEDFNTPQTKWAVASTASFAQLLSR
eukprot:5528055-Amphidinium_carterae.1